MYRCGRVEKSSEQDIRILKHEMRVKTVLDLRGLRHLGGHRVDTKSAAALIDTAYPWDNRNEKADGEDRRLPVRMINKRVKKELASNAIRLGFACPCRLPLIMYQVRRRCCSS